MKDLIISLTYFALAILATWAAFNTPVAPVVGGLVAGFSIGSGFAHLSAWLDSRASSSKDGEPS